MDRRRVGQAPDARPVRLTRRALLGLLGGLGISAIAGGVLRSSGLEAEDPWSPAGWVLGSLDAPRPSSRPFGGTVGVGHLPDAVGYSTLLPFDPPERYPEYPYSEPVSGDRNDGYRLLREGLRAWNPSGFGTAEWNPLSRSIRRGDTVAIKPNLVWEHGWWDRWLGVATTHPSALRAVVDYVYKACGPRGRIVVCEGIATNSAWPEVVRVARLRELVEHLRRDRGVPIELVNLNDVPREDALLVHLGARSMLAPLAGRTLFDLHNHPDSLTGLHGPGSYHVAPLPLEADVVVSLAKLKVHRATGVTLAMKNLYGIIPSWDGPYGDDR